MQNNLYDVSISPHLAKKESIPKIMWSVFCALLPAGIAGVYIFGVKALWVIISCVVSAVVCEAIIQVLTKRKVTVYDGSAALAGLLLAYNLPSSIPLWIAGLGSIFAVAIAKQAFGGLGRNIFNPALAGRAFLMASFAGYMTHFLKPKSFDAITVATPLAALKEGKVAAISQLNLSYFDLFIGLRAGCVGEVCIAALLLGALYLLWKKYITLHTPLSFIITLALFSYVFSAKGLFKGDILFSILSGGAILGAFFMATDYVTSPLTLKGQVIFGAGCGLITFIIRRWGGYPEGVCYSILIMNAVVPIIDRYVKPRRYGIK